MGCCLQGRISITEEFWEMFALSEALFGCVSRFQTYSWGLSVCVTTMCGCWGTSLILFTCMQTSYTARSGRKQQEQSGMPEQPVKHTMSKVLQVLRRAVMLVAHSKRRWCCAKHFCHGGSALSGLYLAIVEDGLLRFDAWVPLGSPRTSCSLQPATLGCTVIA